jgi:aminopeptidase N
MKKYLLYIIGYSFLFSSCATTTNLFNLKKKFSNPVQLKEVKISPQKNNSILPAKSKEVDIFHSDIQVSFDWSKHICYGVETIYLKPYFYDIDSIVLDAQNMIFSKVEVKNTQGDIIQNLISYDKKKLKIQLEKKYNYKDTLILTIQYTAKPDEKEKGGSAAIKDDKGLYFINTSMKEPYKPTQIWTQGETESNSCWFPTIDNPNEKFTSTLSISVNKEMTILSNGEKTSSVIEGNIKTEKWENKLPMPAYLTMMAIGEFDIIVDSLNGKEVSYYLEKQFAPYARNIFKHTPEMISFFGEKLGFQYPWNKYAQVVVRDYVSGAMENTSATLHGDFVQKNNRQLIDASNDDIIAHELFHQWFGDLVTCKTWSHLVLNEGFATLGEQIWIEHKYGKEEALKKSYNRIQRYINYTNKNSDDAIVNSNYNSQEDMFNVLTYQKGASVLNLLKNEIGEDAFFLGLKNYLTTYQYSNTEIADLRKEFEKVTGRDLNLFFNQWFLRGGHPILDIRYVYNDSSKLAQVIVEQVQKNEVGLFNFPLEFKIKQGNKTQSFVFQIEKKKEIFFVEKLDKESLSFPNIIVDPNAVFVGDIKDNKSISYQIVTYNEADNYIEKIRALKELSLVQQKNDTARFTLLSAINDVNEDIRLKALQWIDWKNAQNYIKAKEFLMNLAEKDASPSVRAEALEILADKREPFLLNFYLKLTEDSSYTVSANALDAVVKLIPEEGLKAAKNLEKDAKGELFQQISTLYAAKGDSTNIIFFTKNLMQVFDRNRAILLDDYIQLVTKINSIEYFTQATDLLTNRAIDDENGYIRYAAIINLNELNNHYSTQLKQSIPDDMKSYFLHEHNSLQEKIKSLVNQEQDEYVLGLLKLKGLYNGVKE